ncbi:MAG: tetratricopeptide repeat protein [Deltaproteobacteria bacterium]|nr:tetratricopeptide repeat protein [Deltaproteobacteria bacterium]
MDTRCYVVTCIIVLLHSCYTAPIHKKAKEHNLSAVRLIEESKFELAERHLELALEYNKNYAEAYNNLGVIYLKQNRLEKAEKFFLLAIEYNSDFAEAHNNLGYIYLVNNDFRRALQRFKSALSIDPAFVNARLNLARTYILMGEHKKAEPELLKLKILQSSEEIYWLLVRIYLKMERISDSFSLIEEMMSDERMKNNAIYLKGFVNLNLNRCSDAIDDFEKVQEFFLNNIEFRVNQAAAYICSKEYLKAEIILKQVLNIYANEPSALFNLGRIEYERKNFYSAEEYFRRSYEAGFDLACPYLMDTLFMIGDKEGLLRVSSKCKK